MKKTIKLFVLFIGLISSNANSQDYSNFDTSKVVTIHLDSLKKLYEANTIFFNNGKFVIKGELYKMGFLGWRFKNAIAISKDAYADYLKYKRKAISGITLILVGTVSMVTILTLAPSALIMLPFIPYFIGLIQVSNAPNFIQMATWKFNRDILLKKLKP
jgi:hypothetical protein